MVEVGYALSSEDHAPDALVRNAVAAERAGFALAFDLRPLPPVDRSASAQPEWDVRATVLDEAVEVIRAMPELMRSTATA